MRTLAIAIGATIGGMAGWWLGALVGTPPFGSPPGLSPMEAQPCPCRQDSAP
jgi:hypothetical protein